MTSLRNFLQVKVPPTEVKSQDENGKKDEYIPFCRVIFTGIAHCGNTKQKTNSMALAHK
jgi:hypothetical protein